MINRKVKDTVEQFWNSLDNNQRYQLGDDLVLGTLDWRDWLNSKPPKGFWTEVDKLRILWESSQQPIEYKRTPY